MSRITGTDSDEWHPGPGVQYIDRSRVVYELHAHEGGPPDPAQEATDPFLPQTARARRGQRADATASNSTADGIPRLAGLIVPPTARTATEWATTTRTQSSYARPVAGPGGDR
jgi:hypothetical protein